tara:strand:+ start:422 stop:916 length:495 start_codon:yes stop_codon:yes gene_type:complete
MILSNNFPITFRQVNQLPKLNYHIKEEARVKMLVQAIELKLLNPDTGAIDFYSKDTNYDGKKWNFDLENKILDWPEFLCQFVVLEQYWNRPLNENVYFYRYINIIKSSVNQSIYDNFEKYVLEQQSDSNLKNNMLEYVRYHKKMDNIENFIQNNTIDVSESFSH